MSAALALEEAVRGVPAPPRPIDMEALVQWALAKTGNLPWALARDRELAFDQGLTARPKRRPPGNWALAEACAGLRVAGGRPLMARMTPPDDAAAVIEAIKRLDPRAAHLVLACGRSGIRPNWMPGVEPRLVSKKKSGRKYRKGRPAVYQVWKPCHPDLIRAAREAYSLWHGALWVLDDDLRGTLLRFTVNGLSAPARPWEESLKKTG